LEDVHIGLPKTPNKNQQSKDDFYNVHNNNGHNDNGQELVGSVKKQG